MYRVWDHLMLTSSQRENHAEAAAGAEVMKRSSTARRDPLYASPGHMRHANALARLHQPTESLRAVSLAEKAFGGADGVQPSVWISFYDRPEFDALQWQGTGRAQQIHDALIQSVEVDFVTLLVDSTHPRVQALYEKWGYEKRDEARPSDDSPLYAVMVRTLRES